jgi:hypothetical protein
MVKRAAALLFFGFVAVGCKPDLDQTTSIVTSTRLLGVRATPAEAVPKAQVTLEALVGGPNGAVPSASVEWALCNARKPLAELEPVNPECLQSPTGADFVLLGDGPRAIATIPDVACRNFGPEVPQPVDGQPPGRPVDPDSTGGYYQPVQVHAVSGDGESLDVFRARISCGLAGGTGDEEAAYGHGYRINVNPEVAALTVVGGGALVIDAGGARNTAQAGQKVMLEVSWAACPPTDQCGDGICGPDETLAQCPADCTDPKGCTGAERYVNLDLVESQIVDQREQITVSWFATAGAFDADTTGRSSSDTATTSDNGWRAPSQAGPVTLWVVLRDDRGGVGWAEYALDVR